VQLRVARFDELDPATLYAILRLRVDVFVVEQSAPYPEVDGRDTEPATVHLWFEDGGRPVAYLRMLRDGGEARIGRVCTAATHRGTGLAARLMQAALDTLEPGTPCVLDAQTQATALYARFGFRISGDIYFDDGIEHVPMSLGPRGPAS
jgi:ElaA protein